MLKIAFLFLTIANVHHEDHWKDFFRGHNNHFSIYAHSKEPMPKNSFLKPFEMKNKIETTWSNTMKAQIALLEEALKDPDNEKFVFVSESTIPIQDFDHVYTTVMADDASIFYFEPNPHANVNITHYWPKEQRNLLPIPPRKQFKNSQWVVLNRKHAWLMTQDKEYIEIATKYESDQEHYPSTFLIAKNLLDEIIPQDTTYVEWHIEGRAPYTFTDLNDPEAMLLITQAIDNGYLFARKFARYCNLAPLDQLLPYRKKRTAQKIKPLDTKKIMANKVADIDTELDTQLSEPRAITENAAVEKNVFLDDHNKIQFQNMRDARKLFEKN